MLSSRAPSIAIYSRANTFCKPAYSGANDEHARRYKESRVDLADGSIRFEKKLNARPELAIYDLVIKIYKGSAYHVLPRNAVYYGPDEAPRVLKRSRLFP